VIILQILSIHHSW